MANGFGPLPFFEVPEEWLQQIELGSLDSTVIFKLNQLASRNKLADRDATTIIEILKDIKDEYMTSAQLVKNILERLHLIPKQLSTNTRRQLNEVSWGDQLKLLDEDSTIKIVNGAHMAVEAANLAMLESAIKRHIRNVTKSNTDIKEQIAVFKHELLLVNDEYNTFKSDTDGKVFAANIHDSKAKKLEHMLKELREEMTKNGIPDDSKYKGVLESYEELQAMKLEINKLQVEIEKYDELPPVLDEARNALLQVKQEHEQLGKQISNKIHTEKKFK